MRDEDLLTPAARMMAESKAIDVRALAGTAGGKIYRSADDGATWTRINNSMNVTYIWDIVIDANGMLYAGTENGIYYSNDNGTTWQGPVMSGKDVRALVIDGFDNIYAGTWGAGVYKSTDGTTWTEKISGLDALAVFLVSSWLLLEVS